MSVSREELEKRLEEYGCRYSRDYGYDAERWLTGLNQPFVLWRMADGRYHDADCADIALFILKTAPFEWQVNAEFKKVWKRINGQDQQIGRLRGELRRST
jgi:hypothetical protein